MSKNTSNEDDDDNDEEEEDQEKQRKRKEKTATYYYFPIFVCSFIYFLGWMVERLKKFFLSNVVSVRSKIQGYTTSEGKEEI